MLIVIIDDGDDNDDILIVEYGLSFSLWCLTDWQGNARVPPVFASCRK